MSRLAVLAWVLAACGPQPSGLTPSDITCPPDSTLSYENFGKLVIADNCLTCHGGKQNPRLDTQEAVQDNTQATIDATVISTKMPKGSTMVTDERQLLGEWLSCGAP